MQYPPQFASRTLWNIGWRYLLHHRWQSILMIIGIALGVSVVVAIDLANASAGRAFDLSIETVAGSATHQIVGGPAGLDEKVYVNLRNAGVLDKATPIITTYVSSPQLGGTLMQLLGVDPFTDAPFRDYFSRTQTGDSNQSRDAWLTTILTQPGAAVVSADIAERYGLKTCNAPSAVCNLSLIIDGQAHTIFLAGLLKPSDPLSRRALQNLILTDISTAQELTGRIGKLDRIDLILPSECPPAIKKGYQPAGDYCSEMIASLLPPNVHIVPVEARSGAVEQMTAAFRTNLTALSLLALVVGLFLIYNTMTFSVVRRRSLFGTLRCLGVTPAEIFTLVLSEAAIIGIIGTSLGLVLGAIMGQEAVRTVTQTINDLFFVLSVRGVQLPITSLIKGTVLGILATIATAAPPAWEASGVPPRAALSRSGLESKARKAALYAAIIGVVLLFAGVSLLLLSTRNLILSFVATFAVIVGFAMLAPAATVLIMQLAIPITGSLWGSLGRMAPRDVTNSISRTSIAIAALMVAISVTIGVSLMVSSFRYTVISWLSQTLSGDIYISAPGLTANQSSSPIDPEVIKQLDGWPEVSNVLMLRSVDVDSPAGVIRIAASSNPQVSQERSYLSVDRSPEAIQAGMENGGVIISEPLANRLGLPLHSGKLALYTDAGLREFPVLGIYYDYSSTQGIALMPLDVYRKYWQDGSITAIALRLAPNANIERITQDLQTRLAPIQGLLIRPNQVLRSEVLNVFDRTFAITGALQLLATIVAFIGVLSSLLSIELERQRELGILRAIGLTVRQLWQLLLLETGLMGATAGILAIPTGYTLAIILVYIINRRSFGWTLQMLVLPEPFLQAMAVAIIAALLAGIYPALRLGKIVTAEALRSE
jgi:putative ABC transport system permease protein